MAWKMDSHGKWTESGGSGTKKTAKSKSKKKVTTDKGNTSDTKKSIKVSTSNKENELKYAEEANFEIDGDYKVRRGGKLKINNGVAKRWKGTWSILETTHTIDSRGYKTEGVLGRIPYREKKKSTKKKKSKKKTKSTKTTTKKTTTKKTKTSGTGKRWVMDSHGNWKKK